MPNKDPEKSRAWSKEYYIKNKEKIMAKRKLYFEKNAEKIRAQSRIIGAKSRIRLKEKDPNYRKEYRLAYNRANQNRVNVNKARWVANHPEKAMWNRARDRAKKNCLDFNIEVSDIVIPTMCPIYKIPLVIHTYGPNGKKKHWCHLDSPTLDRIDNTKGYVKGNVWVISWRANHIKNDASLEELEMIVNALKSKLILSE